VRSSISTDLNLALRTTRPPIASDPIATAPIAKAPNAAAPRAKATIRVAGKVARLMRLDVIIQAPIAVNSPNPKRYCAQLCTKLG
jgi:hypothetical protein